MVNAMHRRHAALLVSCLLSASAYAEGGDIIVVEPDPELAAEAANTGAEQALLPKNRGVLTRMVSYGCTRKARKTPEFIHFSKETGGMDVAKRYCECMTGEMINRLTSDHIKTIVKTRKADPKLQIEMRPVPQACLKHART